MRLIPGPICTRFLPGLEARGPLWASMHDPSDRALPFWKATLIALAIEILVPLLVFGVSWTFLKRFEEPPPIPVMSVHLDQPPPEEAPRPQPPPPEKKPIETPRPKPPKKNKPAIAIEPPKPLPNEAKSKIELPKLEPEPEPPPKKEPKKPEPVPDEPPPLPSVFRDVKPVRRVKPIYPREAEDKHIQGRVSVRLSVDLEGNVTDVQLLSADPPGVFDEAVFTAVRQYKFKKDGTTYQADQEIIFKIDD
jgi:protein TonB